jgi:hypothetical protein
MPQTKGAQQQFIANAMETRLKAMDAMAIDMEVLSINPFWYRKDRETAEKIVRINNEKLAEFCASKPDRFAAFASLSLQYPDLAVQQLETAVKKQGLKGAAIGGSVLGEDFSGERFHPVWAKAEELGAVLFIHPQSTPELGKRFKNEAKYRSKWAGLVAGEAMWTHFYHRIADRLGGITHHLVPQDELARLAHPFYHQLTRGGEGHLEVGKNVYYTVNHLCHMVLALKPFGCMPSSQSDGVQSAVINKFKDMVFLPIETSGEGEVNAHSRVQMALGEAKVKAKISRGWVPADQRESVQSAASALSVTGRLLTGRVTLGVTVPPTRRDGVP